MQAGVGALAAAVIGYYHALFPGDAPRCVVVEPEAADCLFRSIEAGDEKPRTIDGKLDTIMAGLACGEPSPVAWEILRQAACCFVTCPDYVAAKGMRIYATPLAGDPFIVSGESGPVTLGALDSILRENCVGELRDFSKLITTRRSSSSIPRATPTRFISGRLSGKGRTGAARILDRLCSLIRPAARRGRALAASWPFQLF